MSTSAEAIEVTRADLADVAADYLAEQGVRIVHTRGGEVQTRAKGFGFITEQLDAIGLRYELERRGYGICVVVA